MSRWTSTTLSRHKPLTFDEARHHEEVVIFLRGRNAYNMDLYIYLELTLGNLQEMHRMMVAGEDFIPGYFGTVLYAGMGEPPEEVKAEMKEKYNMTDVPKPQLPPMSYQQPRLWDEEF